jgi:hypothetical protein
MCTLASQYNKSGAGGRVEGAGRPFAALRRKVKPSGGQRRLDDVELRPLYSKAPASSATPIAAATPSESTPRAAAALAGAPLLELAGALVLRLVLLVGALVCVVLVVAGAEVDVVLQGKSVYCHCPPSATARTRSRRRARRWSPSGRWAPWW